MTPDLWLWPHFIMMVVSSEPVNHCHLSVNAVRALQKFGTDTPPPRPPYPRQHMITSVEQQCIVVRISVSTPTQRHTLMLYASGLNDEVTGTGGWGGGLSVDPVRTAQYSTTAPNCESLLNLPLNSERLLGELSCRQRVCRAAG